jgi:hypothetical protein
MLTVRRHWHKPWKNGDGITTTLRRHLETKHSQDYLDIVDRLRLRSGLHNLTTPENDDEPFSLDRWVELLADWIVVDDQVCPLLYFTALLIYYFCSR